MGVGNISLSEEMHGYYSDVFTRGRAQTSPGGGLMHLGASIGSTLRRSIQGSKVHDAVNVFPKRQP